MNKQIAIAAGLGLVVGGVAYYLFKSSKQRQVAPGSPSSPTGGDASAPIDQMPAPKYPIKIGEHEVSEEQVQEMLKQALEAKKMGNDLLGKGQHEEALRMYSMAIQSVLPLETVPEAQPIFLACCTNMMLVFTKMGKYDEAIGMADQLIQDPQLAATNKDMYRKIHFRRAQAYRYKGDKAEALKDLEYALTLVGNDEASKKSIDDELKAVNAM